jgi:hypothetical protein
MLANEIFFDLCTAYRRCAAVSRPRRIFDYGRSQKQKKTNFPCYVHHKADNRPRRPNRRGANRRAWHYFFFAEEIIHSLRISVPGAGVRKGEDLIVVETARPLHILRDRYIVTNLVVTNVVVHILGFKSESLRVYYSKRNTAVFALGAKNTRRQRPLSRRRSLPCEGKKSTGVENGVDR